MESHKFTTQDHWGGPGTPTRLGEKIKQVLTTMSGPSFYVAIPGRCCSIPLNEWYQKYTKQHEAYRTCANVFINAQYDSFLEFVSELERPPENRHT